MQSSLSDIRDDTVRNLEKEIAHLREDIAALSKTVSRRGRYEDVRDGAADAWSAFINALSKTGSRAYEGTRGEAADAYAAFLHALSKHGLRAHDGARTTASDLYEEMLERGAEAGRLLTDQARRAGRTARENPVTTVAALGLVGLLAMLLFRRS